MFENVTIISLAFFVTIFVVSASISWFIPCLGNKLLAKRKLNEKQKGQDKSTEIVPVKRDTGDETNAKTALKKQELQGKNVKAKLTKEQKLQTLSAKSALYFSFVARVILCTSYSFIACTCINSVALGIDFALLKAFVLWFFLIVSFFIMHIVLYCDCLYRIIPTETCIALFVLGTFLSLLQGGIETFISRGFIAGIIFALMLLCNTFSHIRNKTAAFGGGDAKIIPALCMFANWFALFAGMFSCALFSACLGIIVAIKKRKLRDVHVPLAPGLLVWFITQTLFI